MGNKPINVLFVNDHLGFADGVIHGPTRYFLNIFKCFDRLRIDPKLCILRQWHPFAKTMEAEGIDPIFLSRGKWDPLVLIDMVRLVRELETDVLHLAGMKGSMLGRVVSRITGVPSVVHFRDMNPVDSVTGLLQRSLSSWTDAALAVSAPIRTFAVNEFGLHEDKVEVLHNPISADFMENVDDTGKGVRTEFNISSENRVVGIIGRLSPEKGHELLIRALPGMYEACPELILLIVGDGPTRSKCELLVQELNLERIVRFAGYRNDIPAVLSAVDITVMPSAREGFPNAALESIAAGKPVAGFNVGGISEIVIEGKTGLLAAPGDIGSLAKSIVKMLTDDEVAEKMKGECRIHSNTFKVESHIQRLEEIYRNLLS